MGDFKKDLEEGQEIELKLCEILKKRNPDCTIERPEGYFTDYDIKLIKPDGTFLTIEVKYDRMTQITGNVALEISFAGRPSGIVKSKADYIVYYINGQFYLAPREGLREKIIEYEKVKGGDNEYSELILITFHEFLKIFSPL